VGQVWEYVQYVVLLVVAVLAADMILDWVRSVWGRPKNERVAKALDAFDAFCDQLRRIVGSGPLGQLTRGKVQQLAGMAYDLAEGVFSPVWSREEWIAAVVAWYDEQVAIEEAVRRAYVRTVPEPERGEIAARSMRVIGE